ncbi:hypothetical protein HZZ13_05560 [Bradyrhizobium sp. CNPSo 4010]|uniref:Uncharacterized protein n=1 Tax=Bradyrhizobium agreste TaxID=2751811 RepID=A0ABS0PJ80_9BRAD|nr:hypothetical protein [Bradyrhizobium agreste]MBH5397260.1 hypothetical protein [Bradyrhizobium agreste]
MKRDALINWNAPVRTIGIEHNADGTPIRDPFKSVWTHKGMSPVFAGRDAIAWEGENERQALWFERFVRRAFLIAPQPEIIWFEVDGYVVGHIPDFLVQRPTGTARVGVKGLTAFAFAPWTSDKLRAITRAYAQKGLLYEPVTAMDLRRPPLAHAVDEIWRARRVRFEFDDRDHVMKALKSGPITLGDVHSVLGAGDPRRALALHAQGVITIDITSSALGSASKVVAGNLDLGRYSGELP